MRDSFTHQYCGRVEAVCSGDDLVVMVDLGVEDLFKRVRVRLAGVDTPPYQGRAAEGAAGEVRRWVRDMTRGKDILLLVHSRLSNSWVCTVIVDHSGDNPIDLNAELVAKGYVYSKGNK